MSIVSWSLKMTCPECGAEVRYDNTGGCMLGWKVDTKREEELKAAEEWIKEHPKPDVEHAPPAFVGIDIVRWKHYVSGTEIHYLECPACGGRIYRRGPEA